MTTLAMVTLSAYTEVHSQISLVGHSLSPWWAYYQVISYKIVANKELLDCTRLWRIWYRLQKPLARNDCSHMSIFLDIVNMSEAPSFPEIVLLGANEAFLNFTGKLCYACSLSNILDQLVLLQLPDFPYSNLAVWINYKTNIVFILNRTVWVYRL